jgi:hypothetical protein
LCHGIGPGLLKSLKIRAGNASSIAAPPSGATLKYPHQISDESASMIGHQLIVHNRTVPDLLVLGHAESQAECRLRRSWSQVSFFAKKIHTGQGHEIEFNKFWQKGLFWV